MKKLDQIFRTKLETFELPPPTNGWSRVEAALQKKNKRVAWFRWAAAVSLLALTGMWWYIQTQPGAEKQITQNTESQAGAEQGTPPAPPINPEPLLPAEEKKKEEKKPLASAPQKQKKQPEPQHENGPPETQTEAVATLAAASAPTTTEVIAATPDEPAPETTNPVVIAFFLPTVTPTEETSPAEAVREKTSLDKFKTAARQLKHSEGWLGKIRTAKNDLFARL